MKTKVYIANSVFLNEVPNAHRGNNGNCQFNILVATTSQKRVAELTGTSLSCLRRMGVHEAGKEIGYGDERKPVCEIVTKDETIYYNVQQTHKGYVGKWFEYKPKKKVAFGG